MHSTPSSTALMRKEQVLTMTTSQSWSSSTDSNRGLASMSVRMRSESTSFLAQPRVTILTRRGEALVWQGIGIDL